MRIASCCSFTLCIISTFDPHLVTTSPFNFFSGKFFCCCAFLNSFCLFQLFEKDGTTFLHKPITQSIHGSLRPLMMAKSKLWPKQLTPIQVSNLQATLILLSLSAVMATSSIVSNPHSANDLLRASCRCSPM